MTELQRLNLGVNQILAIGTGLDSLQSLLVLNLRRNKISVPDEILHLGVTLPNLREIDFSENPVALGVPECAAAMKGLERCCGAKVASRQSYLPRPEEDVGKLRRENRRLQGEVDELKQHNSKLTDELEYRSKVLINKNKDLCKNNERLVELEQELAMFKLNSIASPSKSDLATPEPARQRALSFNNVLTGARNVSELPSSQKPPETPAPPNHSLQSEIADLRSHKGELIAALAHNRTRLEELTREKSVRLSAKVPPRNKSLSVTRPQSSLLLQSRSRSREMASVLQLSSRQRQRSLELQKEVFALREGVRAKNEHLAVLRKQLAEQESNSILSDIEGFLVQEERASHQELCDLESQLRAKEKEYSDVLRGLGQITAHMSGEEPDCGEDADADPEEDQVTEEPKARIETELRYGVRRVT